MRTISRGVFRAMARLDEAVVRAAMPRVAASDPWRPAAGSERRPVPARVLAVTLAEVARA